MVSTLRQEALSVINALQNSGTAIVPTDTIPGIACNALDEKAVLKIFEIKNRIKTKPYAIFVSGADWILQNCILNKEQQDYVKTILPGAFTIVAKLKNAELAAKLGGLIAPNAIVGIRVPNDPLCLEVSKLFDGFMAATSVNLSGEPPAKNFAEINPLISSKANFICKAEFFNGCSGKPSSIADLTKDTIEVQVRG